jgi:hypothetical protein
LVVWLFGGTLSIEGERLSQLCCYTLLLNIAIYDYMISQGGEEKTILCGTKDMVNLRVTVIIQSSEALRYTSFFTKTVMDVAQTINRPASY